MHEVPVALLNRSKTYSCLQVPLPVAPVRLGMLFGGTDTLLGIGSPELLVILVIGYFVLGPIELFKLAKQAGVLAGQLKDIGLGTVNNLGKIVDEQVLPIRNKLTSVVCNDDQ